MIFKKVSIFILTGVIFLAISNPAYAKTNSYLIDNHDNIGYEFSKSDLVESFLNGKRSEPALLYEEYSKLLGENSLYAFHDDSNKYVGYKEIVKKFLYCKQNKMYFNLEYYVENEGEKMFSLPAKIFKVKVINKEIHYIRAEDNKKTEDNKEKIIEEMKVINIE